eukprot:2003877-Rhodomonas_salina.1
MLRPGPRATFVLQGVQSATSLRAFYVQSATSLRACYAKPGTDPAYAPPSTTATPPLSSRVQPLSYRPPAPLHSAEYCNGYAATASSLLPYAPATACALRL